MESELRDLTSGKLLVRNTIINFLGRFAPMVVALFAIPVLIRQMGTDRFGILTLVWVLIGYFSLFDFGLGRALTKLVAEKLGAEDQTRISGLVWTGMLLMTLLGILGGSVVGLLSSWLVCTLLNVPLPLQNEMIDSMVVLAFSLPIVISTTGFVAVLEARQEFGIVNSVRVITGVFMYLSPLVVLPYTHSLTIVVLVFAIGRLLTAIVYVIITLKVMPSLRNRFVVDRTIVKRLVSFGGWITLNNIVDPFMVYADRFLIGTILSMTAVAYYTTPYEVVTKIWMYPTAVASVFFPAFSTSYMIDRRQTILIFARAVKSIFIVLFPVTLIIVTFAQEGLTLWLGSNFALHSKLVLQCLAVGVFVNSLARIPDVLIQGIGRPDLILKLKAVELPLYCLSVWIMIKDFGIEGAAIAWALRIVLDTFLLFFFSKKLLPEATWAKHRVLGTAIIATLVLGTGFFPFSLTNRLILLLMIMVLFALFTWNVILSNDERLLTKHFLRLVTT